MTTVLTSDWSGAYQQPAAAAELRGRGHRAELQRAARDELLRRDRAGEVRVAQPPVQDQRGQHRGEELQMIELSTNLHGVTQFPLH